MVCSLIFYALRKEGFSYLGFMKEQNVMVERERVTKAQKEIISLNNQNKNSNMDSCQNTKGKMLINLSL
jgi:hypothetical protein